MTIPSSGAAGGAQRVPATARGASTPRAGTSSSSRSIGTRAADARDVSATPGGVLRASSFSSDDDRIPDAGGASSRASGSRAKPDSTGVARGSNFGDRPRDEDRSSPGDASTSGASRGDPRERGAGAPSAESERLEIPEAHADAGEPLDTAPLEREVLDSPLRPLHAHWQQVADGGNSADFGPGGFDLSLISIRPGTQKSLALHRAWGDPTQQQLGGEFRAEFTPDGSVRLAAAPTAPSRFDERPIVLPAQGTRPPRTITPPVRALPFTTSWKLEQPDLLRLDGRLYRRIDQSTFDRLRRGNAAAPTDLATRAARAGPSRTRPEPAGGVDFFGARAEGTHFCYLCDISGSMEGSKLVQLRDELLRSLRALPPGTQVQVVFFNSRAHLLSPDWKRTGTRGFDALLADIARTGCGDDTDPTPAVNYAFTQLDPRPDAVFLLTDGQFESDVAGQLARLNPPTDQTRVHTIGLGGDVSAATLRAIAAANGGTFTQVPAASP